MTNFEKIKSMSIEELAVFIDSISYSDEDNYGDYDPHIVIDGAYLRDSDDVQMWLESRE